MTAGDERTTSRWLHLGPWRIDLERATVAIGVDASGLSPRAESLLLLLCRHANELVTREQILENVWAGRVVEDAAITNCIWQIRKALGEHGKEILQTRAKRGYVMSIAQSAWRIDEAAVTPISGGATNPEDQSAVHSSPAPTAMVAPIAIGGTKSDVETHSGDAHVVPNQVAQSQPLSVHRRYWLRWLTAIIVVSLIGFAVFPLIIRSLSHGRIALLPGTDMSVTIIAPEKLKWLRIAVLHAVVEHAYLRDAQVVVFEKPQRKNPFSGPHLQVMIAPEQNGEVQASLSINQGQLAIRQHFRGPASELSTAIEKMIMNALGLPSKPPTPASDALISGLVDELRFDNQSALAEFDRAIARDSGMLDAKIAMARVLFAQGRSRDALGFVDQLVGNRTMTEMQQCQLNVLLVDVAPDRLREPLCTRANDAVKQNRLELRDLVRALQSTRDQPKSASQWQEEETQLISAYLRLQELHLAESEIERSEHLTQEAGWERARIELDAARGLLANHRGQNAEATRMQLRTAERMRAIGDIDSALYYQILGLQVMPLVPGASTSERRAVVQSIINEAKDIGSVESEIGALNVLLRLDRDRPEAWQSGMARIRKLVTEEHTAETLIGDLHRLLDEVRIQHRYQEVLDGIAEIEKTGATDTQAQIWNLTLRAEAHFARDEISDAVAAVDAMQKENFEIADTSDLCLFSWLFVEAHALDRAKQFLKQCQAVDYDRAMQASRGDYGLLAQARLYQGSDEPQRAWQLLQPRIEHLLGTADMTRQEAESLTLLARHSISMPSADRARLQQVLTITTTIAGQDGAGPGLRLGVYLLRWRLCASAGRTDCGPALPAWAAEDLLEARLAREAVQASAALTKE